MDQAIAATDLGAGRGSWWHPVLDVLQWLALLTAVVGAGWLGVLALAGYLQFPLPPRPRSRASPSRRCCSSAASRSACSWPCWRSP
ncbi:hypothetical protein GY12_01745 [Micrococcus luteus]|nr:hypothetical protein GY12_01745 [Micrococcus luteus]